MVWVSNSSASILIRKGQVLRIIPAASPPVIPGALLVLAMTLGYTSMDRLPVNKNPNAVATSKHLGGGPTGLPVTETRASKD
jgi:hypothetical protein